MFLMALHAGSDRPRGPASRGDPSSEEGAGGAGTFEAEVATALTRLPAYLAEPRPPLTVGELAAEVGLGPLAVGAAILELHERGQLTVAVQPGLRFALRLA